MAQTSATIDGAALERLREAAEHANSDAVVILQDGKPMAEWYFGEESRPIEAMSVVKSIVSLGVGSLLASGAIDSLDQPVHSFYPEWRQGLKREITIRHLLNHTSGIQNVPNAGAEIYPSPNAVQLALAADLTDAPGTVFSYNNKAVNLLAGIMEEASGQRMDRYFVDVFFAPMGITEYQWYYDESGSPHAMAGLRLHARDLAKFGQLVLQHGRWEEVQLVSEAYIDEMLAQAQPYDARFGLLWWRLPSEMHYVLDTARIAELDTTQIPANVLADLRTLNARRFPDRTQRDAAVEAALGADWQTILADQVGTDANSLFRREYGPIVAYYGDGYLGQTLMVIPEHGIVAVRLVEGGDEYDPATDGFSEFKAHVLRLVPE